MGSPDVAQLARAKGPRVLQILESIAENEDAPPGARVSAAVAIWDRGYGRPTEYVQMRQEGVKVVQPSQKQLTALAGRVLLTERADEAPAPLPAPPIGQGTPPMPSMPNHGDSTISRGKSVSLYPAQPLGGNGETDDDSAARDRGAGFLVR